MKGYIALHRTIADHPLWLKEKFTQGQAWVDLLMLANHKDGFMTVHGVYVEIKRGQVGWSMRALAKRWKWSIGKVSRYLEMLEKNLNQICVKNVPLNGTQNETQNGTQNGTQKTHLTTLITIVNYDEYQKKRDTEQNTERDIEQNTERDTNGTQTELNNNDNKYPKGGDALSGQNSTAAMWSVGKSMGIDGALIGQAIKQHGEPKIAEIISQMSVRTPADPKTYFMKATQKQKRERRTAF